jgi:hypothetical protein
LRRQWVCGSNLVKIAVSNGNPIDSGCMIR